MNWLDLARDSRKAAAELVQEKRYRSSASRAYYAAFSKITQELVSAGVIMPAGYEGPSHSRVRPLVETRLSRMNMNKRIALSHLIGRLYTLRIDADYRPSVEFEGADAREALSIMNKIFEAF